MHKNCFDILCRLLPILVRIFIISFNEFACFGVSYLVTTYDKTVFCSRRLLILEHSHFFGALTLKLLALATAHSDGTSSEFDIDGWQIIIRQVFHDIFNLDYGSFWWHLFFTAIKCRNILSKSDKIRGCVSSKDLLVKLKFRDARFFENDFVAELNFLYVASDGNSTLIWRAQAKKWTVHNCL